MPVTEFYSEWMNVDDTCIYMQCRAGFPDEKMYFMAQVAVRAMRAHSNNARLVHVFYDDYACVTSFIFASDDPNDKSFANKVVGIINDIFAYENNIGKMLIVPVGGNKSSDHYNHMEHLSIEAGIAVDRWKHKDKYYQDEV